MHVTEECPHERIINFDDDEYNYTGLCFGFFLFLSVCFGYEFLVAYFFLCMLFDFYFYPSFCLAVFLIFYFNYL